MRKINIYPKNKRKFIKLVGFGREIVSICKKVGVIPIVYGSLAHFYYSKDKNMVVNDFDFLIHKKYFNKIIDILKKKKIKYNYINDWNSLQVFKNNLRIELDHLSIKNKKKIYHNLIKFNYYNLDLKIISLNDLIKIYKEASKTSKDKPKEYRKKYLMLKTLKR